MAKLSPKIKAKKPLSAFEKPLKADFKTLFKGLSKGIGHATVGKWEELGNDAVEALGAVGLTTEPSELASLLIRRSLIRAMFELVGEIASQHLTEVKSNASELEEQIDFSIFKQEVFVDRNFLKRPTDLELISVLQPLLEMWLTLQGVPKPAAHSVVTRLPSYFVYALNVEWRRNAKSYQSLLTAIETPFAEAGDREWAWTTYTALLQKRVNEGVFDESFSLAQLYVPLNAFYEDDACSTGSPDGALRGAKYERRVVVNLEKELEQWLASQDPTDAIRVISGGPGSGKSSFARIFAAKSMEHRGRKVLFVPLHLIDATKDLPDEVGRFVKDEGVLLHNPLDTESADENLLIIFDGLDELASQGKAAAETARAFVREVERTVEKRNLQRLRLRVLISGRELVVQENQSEFRRRRQILNLLPYYVPDEERAGRRHAGSVPFEYVDAGDILGKDLRQIWWRQYGILSGNDFKGLPKELAREDLAEISAQPLLNYLVALTYTRGTLDFSKDINLNLIYSDLVAAVYQRGYERKRTYGPIRHMSLEQFSRVLEEVGLAAWHGDGRSTTVKEIEEHCRLSGVGTLLDAFQEGAKAGVTRLLAAFFFRQHGQRASGDPTFVFTHKSFGEYLTARRVIRATERVVRETEKRNNSPDEGWDERDALKHWAQICGPSAISQYLHVFLVNELRIRAATDLQKWQASLALHFSHVLKHGMPMEQMPLSTFRDAVFRARNSEEALLVVMNGCARVTHLTSEVQHGDPTAFGAWFKKVQGQRTSGETGLVARCLSYLNLSGVYLDIADLYKANFQYSKLHQVKAHLACLENANFQGADLSGAILWRANLQGANLVGANLTEASLEEADLRGANLHKVELGTFKARGILTDNLEPASARKTIAEKSAKEEAEFSRRMKRPVSVETDGNG
jgi:hypothetical protein